MFRNPRSLSALSASFSVPAPKTAQTLSAIEKQACDLLKAEGVLRAAVIQLGDELARADDEGRKDPELQKLYDATAKERDAAAAKVKALKAQAKKIRTGLRTPPPVPCDLYDEGELGRGRQEPSEEYLLTQKFDAVKDCKRLHHTGQSIDVLLAARDSYRELSADAASKAAERAASGQHALAKQQHVMATYYAAFAACLDRLIAQKPQVSGVGVIADRKTLEAKLAKLVNQIADLVSWKSVVSDQGMSQDGPCFWIGILRARRDAVKRQLAGMPALTVAQKEDLAAKFGELFGISECDKFSYCGMIFEWTGRESCVYARLSYPESALDVLVDAVRTLHAKLPEGAPPLYERPDDIEAVGDALDKLRAFYEEAGVVTPQEPPSYPPACVAITPSFFKRAERFRNLRQNLPLSPIVTPPPKAIPERLYGACSVTPGLKDATACRISYAAAGECVDAGPFLSVVGAAQYAVDRKAEWWRIEGLDGSQLALH